MSALILKWLFIVLNRFNAASQGCRLALQEWEKTLKTLCFSVNASVFLCVTYCFIEEK
jgi:hypothetical protein